MTDRFYSNQADYLAELNTMAEQFRLAMLQTNVTSVAGRIGDVVLTMADITDMKAVTGNVLLSAGAGLPPSFGKLPLASAVAGTLGVGNGGTGLTSFAVGDLLYASGTGTLAKLADIATGNVLLSGGVGVAPSYGKVGLTTHVSGTLPIANGGTNATATPTNGGVSYGTGSAYAFTAAGASAQVLRSNGAAAPTWATLDMSYLPDATFKKSVKVSTTAALTVSMAGNVLTNTGTLAALALDGVALATNDRVLVQHQASALQNGIYYVTNAGSASVAWTLTRAADADSSAEIGASIVGVDSGSTYGGRTFKTTFKTTDTLNTSSVVWMENIDSGNLPGNVRVTPLTGLSTATSTAVTATDTVLVGIGKLQAQSDLKAPLASPSFSGTATFNNIVVNGTTTTVNSTVTTLDDPVLTLGGDTAPAVDDNKDRGVEFRWHNGTAAKVGFFGFDDSTGKMTFIPDATNTGEVFTGTKGEIDAALDWSNLLNKPVEVGYLTGVTSNIQSQLGGKEPTIGYGVPQRASGFALGSVNSLAAIMSSGTSRSVSDPFNQIGYAGGMRVRFGYMDDVSGNYADIIDLSTYSDASGGGINALYFRKQSQEIYHKWAAAGGTAWTTKVLLSADTSGTDKTVLTGRNSGGPAFQQLDLTYMPTAWTKHSVRCASTTNLSATATTSTLTNNTTLAALVLDGITVAAGDRVLIMNQTTSAQNGIYDVTNAGSASVAWVLTRSAGANASVEIAGGMVGVDSGTSKGGSRYGTSFKSTDTLGTTNMVWYQLIHDGHTIAANRGGTGQTSFAVGDILYASSTSALSKLAAGAAGSFLKSNGAAAPAWTVLSLADMPDAWAKKSVRVATTANLTASYAANVLTNTGTLAALVIDGVTLALNDRVLVKNQTTSAHNGIYYLSTLGTASVAWKLTRTAGANTSSEIAAAVVAVDSGTAYGGDLFTTTFKSTDTLGTSNMVWYEEIDTGNLAANLPKATTSVLGVVKPDGVTVMVDANGVISAPGAGTVSSVNGVSPNGSGEVTLDAGDVGALATTGGVVSGAVDFNNRVKLDEVRYRNANTQRFVQSYTPASYLTAGEYQEIATITPAAGFNNYDLYGRIFVQSGSNVQVIEFNAGLRSNSLPDLEWDLMYSESAIGGVFMARPVLFTKETAPAAFKLAIQHIAGTIHNITVELNVVNRSYNDDVVMNTTNNNSDYASIPAGYTQQAFDRVRSMDHISVDYAGTVKASSFDGNSTSTTKLATARNINGVPFDGQADITVTDDTKLPLTGGSVTGTVTFPRANIMRSNNASALRMGGDDNDVNILRVANNPSGNSNSADWGFTISYMGSRAGNDNSLSIFADNSNAATQIEAVQIKQNGDVVLAAGLTVQNLIVNGTTTTVNSTAVTLDDPILTLGGDTAPGVDDGKDRGVEVRWHNGTSAKVSFFGLDRSTAKFTFIPDATNTGEVFTGTKGWLDMYVAWADLQNKPATDAEFGYLTGVTSGIQGQLNTKLNATQYVNTSRQVTDANLADDVGVRFDYLPNNAANRPVGQDHYLMTVSYSNQWSTQVAADPRTNDWFLRSQNAGTWAAWVKFWHSGNLTNVSQLTNDAGYVSAATPTLYTAKQSFSGSATSLAAVLTNCVEKVTIDATAATGTVNYDLTTQAIVYKTANATANHTLNIRGNASNTLNSLLGVGESVTLVYLNTCGATAYYPNVIQIDGVTVTPKWQGGTAPTAGNASSIDSYSFTIIKTAATPTYLVLASQTQFK